MSNAGILRGALLALVAAVVGSVAWTLRRPASSPPASEPAPAPPAPSGAAQATRMGDLVYRSLRGGREAFVLRARSLSGREQEQLRLETVTAEFGYVADGQPGRGSIVSDECVYFPARQEAYFQGHVRLVTGDGFELLTDQLVYEGAAGRARSETPVRFKRNRLAGGALAMAYLAEGGRLELTGEVELRIADEERGALVVTSRKAAFLRAEGEAQFEEGVRVTRGGDVLTAARLTLYGAEDELDRARAAGDVRVVSSSASPPWGPVRAAPSRRSGPRELSCQQLDVELRPDRSLQEAVASGDSVLVVQPAEGERRERRTLKGSVLTFRWDERERLIEALGQKDAAYLGEPLAPDKRPPLQVRSRNFQALFAPETGAASSVEFNRDVALQLGPQRAGAQRGYYTGADAKLSLGEEPWLEDEEQGSRLTAETIELFLQSGDLRARYGVRHVVKQRPERGAALPGTAADTAALSARFFEFESAARLARYREGALLRAGKSELRAVEIRRIDAGPGRRRLEADGDVVMLLAASPAPGRAEPAQPPLEARAQRMSYDQERGEIAYAGGTSLRQGEIRTESPEALLRLAPDRSRLERLEAFDPVELRQGARLATGQRAVYTPADSSIVVTGEKVELVEEAHQVRGRVLTFYVGDDRILVDGREEARTETILRRKP